MAIRYAVASSNWNNVATWDGGISIPSSGDIVYLNNKTIGLDIDVIVDQLRSDANTGLGIVAGGILNIITTRSLTASNGFYTGVNGIISVNANSPEIIAISGDIYPTPAGRFLNIAGSCTINMTGSIMNSWGGYNSGAIYMNGTGILNIIGDLQIGTHFASAVQHNNWAVYNANIGTVNITGVVQSTNSGYCVVNAGIGNINIIGSVYPYTTGASSWAVYATGNGNISVIGIIDMLHPLTASAAIKMTGLGTVSFSGTVINRNDLVAIDSPKMILLSAASTTWTFVDDFIGTKNLYTADLPALGNPATTNVRNYVSYGPIGELLGTLKMAPPTTVLLGVDTDNTIGTLLMTPADFWAVLLANIITPNSIGVRLKDCATVESTGNQIANLT